MAGDKVGSAWETDSHWEKTQREDRQPTVRRK